MSVYPSKSQELERNRTLPGAPVVRRTRERILEERRARKSRVYDLTCRSEGSAPRWLHCRERMEDATALRVQEQRKDVGGAWASQYNHPYSVRDAKDRSWRARDVVVFAKKVRRAMARGWLRVCADRLRPAEMCASVARGMVDMGMRWPGAAVSRHNDEALDRVRGELGMSNDNQSHGAIAPGSMEYAGWEEWRLYFVVCGWTLEEAGEILRLAGMDERSLHRGVAEGAEMGRRAA